MHQSCILVLHFGHGSILDDGSRGGFLVNIRRAKFPNLVRISSLISGDASSLMNAFEHMRLCIYYILKNPPTHRDECVEPSRLSTYPPYLLTFLLHFVLSTFLPFVRTSSPQGGGIPSPLPPSCHQLGILSGTRASSEATFSDANFRIDFRWHFCDCLSTQSSKHLCKHDPKWLHKSIPKRSEN